MQSLGRDDANRDTNPDRAPVFWCPYTAAFGSLDPWVGKVNLDEGRSSVTYTSRSDALGVQCPICPAQPDEKCVGARGKKRESVHRERMSAAAHELQHAPVTTFTIVGDKLIDAEGTTVGRLLGLELDLQSETLGGNLRRGGEVDFDVSSDNSKTLIGVGSAEGRAQTSLLADPVDETWALYVDLLNRPKAKLDGKVRRWIADAHGACGVEPTRDAIRGLAASSYHRENGYVGIEYAIKPKMGETLDGRISMMASKVATGDHGTTTVQRLMARLPSETHSMVKGWIADVEAMLRSPNHRGLAATGQGALADLETKAFMAPVIEGPAENRRIVDWKDLKR